MEAVFRTRGQNLSYFGLAEGVVGRLDTYYGRPPPSALCNQRRHWHWEATAMRSTPLRLSAIKGEGEDVPVQTIVEHDEVKSSRNVASLIL